MNSKQVNETVNKLFSFMQDVKDGNLRTVLENMLQLQHWEAELERLLQWKPKEKKRPIPQKKTNAQLRNEKLADIPDLFDL